MDNRFKRFSIKPNFFIEKIQDHFQTKYLDKSQIQSYYDIWNIRQDISFLETFENMIQNITILTGNHVYDAELDDDEIVVNLAWESSDLLKNIKDAFSFTMLKHFKILIFWFHLRQTKIP